MDLVVISRHVYSDNIKKMIKGEREFLIVKDNDSFPDEIRKKILDLSPDSVFIIGTERTIPFYKLKNPVKGDQDEFVLSDNPYASKDNDFIIPEIPIGRLPFDDEEDILTYLNNLKFIKKEKLIKGYTANIWKNASLNVMGHIDPEGELELSPPSDRLTHVSDMSKYSFLYYNLHGSTKYPYWFGQSEDGTDYPVALSEECIVKASGSIVVSEACYGAYIEGKKKTEALSLIFLDRGAVIFVGSTVIAYGPFYPPATEADLLVMLFMLYSFKSDISFGKAFLDAKIMFARHNIWLNGYLDRDDKKTLIEFILYGDPLLKMGEGDG